MEGTEGFKLFAGMENMISVIVVACLLVITAMLIDLAAGLYKAKQRGEIRSSWGLKRTLGKFISYIGSLLIASGIDILMHVCSLAKILRLDLLYGVPVITCLIAIFLLIVEMISIREKADEKTKTEMSRAAQVVGSVVSRDELVSALTEAIADALKPKNKEQ